MSSSRGRPVKYDREVLLSIPKRMENGSTFEDIAEELKTSPRLLMQVCRRAGVLADIDATRLRLPIDVEVKLKKRAGEMGMTAEALAARLIEVVCRDGLFEAVLED